MIYLYIYIIYIYYNYIYTLYIYIYIHSAYVSLELGIASCCIHFQTQLSRFSDTQRKEIDGAVILGLIHGRSRDGSDGKLAELKPIHDIMDESQ